MALLKIKIVRNLRKTILRGHPWVFKEAVEIPKLPADAKAQLARVVDAKGDLAWAMFDPHGSFALRILSTGKSAPTNAFFEARFARALFLRKNVRSKDTNAFRLFNGEGDLLPGLVCDVYDSIAVLQFDGQGPGEFWDRQWIAGWLLANAGVKSVVEKTRRSQDRTTEHVAGEISPAEIVVREHGALFKVNIEKGQKTGFFLDQRENRLYVRQTSAGKSVLNLFSYSGGFSIYAGLGGARRVASLDIAKGAIALAEENWDLNGLPKGAHQGLCVDVFEYLQGDTEMWDHIIVDPPSMSHSESQKDLAKAKYIEVFSAAAKRVTAGGELSLSSCSSHITFDDFLEVTEEALSIARRSGQYLRVSGQGPDHPFPHANRELRYLKYVHLALD